MRLPAGSPIVVWTCRAVLATYGTIVLGAANSMLADWDTTIRLIGSEAQCSAAPFQCSLTSYLIELAIVATVILAAVVSEVAWSWRHRHRVRAAAALLAAGHVFGSYVLGEIGRHL